MVCEDGSNVVSITVGVAQSSVMKPVLSLDKCDVGQEISMKRNLGEFSNKAQAQIVRAFYDAAEKVVVEHDRDGNSAQSAQQAISDLKKVFDQAQELGPEEFAKALEAAAATYFSRVANLVPFETSHSSTPAFEAPNDGPENSNEKFGLSIMIGADR